MFISNGLMEGKSKEKEINNQSHFMILKFLFLTVQMDLVTLNTRQLVLLK